MDNIGAWEVAVALKHNLHESWLVPFGQFAHGTECPCCRKMRADSHYVMDTAQCVFCFAECCGKPKCRSRTGV